MPNGSTETLTAGAPEAPRHVSRWIRTREVRFAALLLIPSIIVIFGIVIYPIGKTIYTSFFDVKSALQTSTHFVGLHNYSFAVSTPAFWQAVVRTIHFTVVSTILEVVFGIGIALLLNAKLRARWLFRSIVVLAWALPTIVNGAMWRYMFDAQYGVVNAFMTQTGLQSDYVAYFNSGTKAMNIVIFADVWKNTSLCAFLLLAGLTTIPRDIYEAARVDGAGPIRSFISLTLPLLKPAIIVVLVLRTIEAFKVFDIIYIMTRGGPANATQSIAYYTYQQAFSDEYFSYGAALSVLIVLFILAFAVIYVRQIGTEDQGYDW